MHPTRTVLLLIAALCLSLGLPSRGRADVSLCGESCHDFALTGWMRTREYVWAYFNPGKAALASDSQNQYDYQANALRFGLRYQRDGVRLYVEGMNPALFSLPPSAATPGKFASSLGTGAFDRFVNNSGNDASLFLKQGYVEFGEDFVQGLGVRGGRFEFSDGAEIIPRKDPELSWLITNQIQQRLIGNFGFSDMMRSFDGASVRYDYKAWNATLMYGAPTKGVWDLDGIDEVKGIDVLYASINAGPQEFWGNSVGRLFYVWYDDNRHLIPADNEPAKVAAANTRSISLDTMGGDFVHVEDVGPGRADLIAWGAFQFGNWGKLTQKAFAVSAQAGYRFTRAAWKPWFRETITSGSGDGNPSDGRHETFFDLMPTPRIYALNPVYNDLMNLFDLGTEIILAPLPNLEARSTFHTLWLNSHDDRWYAGGGAFNNKIFGYFGKPSGGADYLGTSLDTGVTCRLNNHVSLYLYGGHLFGGTVVANNFPGGRGETFGYVETILTL